MKSFFLAPLAAAAFGICGVASAQMAPGYVGLQIGNSRASAECGGAATCDKSDTAYKVYAGFGQAPWTLELGYTDFGKVRASALFGGVRSNAEIKTRSLGVGAAYHVPFNAAWNGVVRFGIAANRVEFSSTAGAPGSDSETKARPYLGLGIGYALTKQVSVTGTWDWTEAKFAGDTAKYNVLSIGLNYAF